MKKYFAIILIVISLLPFVSNADDKLRVITVNGQAMEDFNPDIASFSVTVTGKNANRNEAKSAHDKVLKSLLELAKKYKIDDKDISTRFSSINPTYEYNSGKRKFIDYTAQTLVNITLRDLSQAGQFQENLVTAGFDNFQGPSYELDKIYTYNDKILEKAVANAKDKATKIASGLGEKLDKAIEIREEGVSGYNPQPLYMAKSSMLMAGSAAPESAIAPPSGVITIRSAVVVTFSIH